MLYLVSLHHPEGYDGSLEPAQMGLDIDALNEEMEAAGVRVFAGGLHPSAKSLVSRPDGVKISDGLYLKKSEYVGGFWILNCASLEEVLKWGEKAVVACRAPVEVRQFFEV